MKVILMQELKGRGGEGDIIEVARGFAVNYLLPRKIAIEATSGNIKQLEQRMHNIKKREESRVGDAQAFLNSLEGKKVVIEVKVGDEGRLFGSVTGVMVAEAIQNQLGIEVDRRKVETHGHLKTIGEHEVEVAIYRDIKAHVVVEIVGEGTVAEEVAPEAELAAPVVEEVAEVVETVEPVEETSVEEVAAEESAE